MQSATELFLTLAAMWRSVFLSDVLRGIADGETKFVKESQIQNILL